MSSLKKVWIWVYTWPHIPEKWKHLCGKTVSWATEWSLICRPQFKFYTKNNIIVTLYMLSADVRVTPAHWCTTDCKNFNDLLMILFVFRLVQSTCAASPSPAFFWLLRPVRRTRWTQTPRHTCRNTHIIRQTLRLEPHDYVFLLKHNFCCLLHLASALFWWFRTPKTPFENSTDSVLVLKLKAFKTKTYWCGSSFRCKKKEHGK